MSEQFPSIRHLSGYVKQRLTEFQQLDAAIAEIQTQWSTLADRKQQLKEAEKRLEDVQGQIREADGRHQQHAEEIKGQRVALQTLLKKEQQERVEAREKFEREHLGWTERENQARATLKALDVDILSKQKELTDLDARLAETVNAVLRRG